MLVLIYLFGKLNNHIEFSTLNCCIYIVIMRELWFIDINFFFILIHHKWPVHYTYCIDRVFERVQWGQEQLIFFQKGLFLFLLFFFLLLAYLFLSLPVFCWQLKNWGLKSMTGIQCYILIKMMP